MEQALLNVESPVKRQKNMVGAAGFEPATPAV